MGKKSTVKELNIIFLLLSSVTKNIKIHQEMGGMTSLPGSMLTEPRGEEEQVGPLKGIALLNN